MKGIFSRNHRCKRVYSTRRRGAAEKPRRTEDQCRRVGGAGASACRGEVNYLAGGSACPTNAPTTAAMLHGSNESVSAPRKDSCVIRVHLRASAAKFALASIPAAQPQRPNPLMQID